MTIYTLPDDPHVALLKGGAPRAGMITPEQAAAEVVDAAEKPRLPLRIPIGDADGSPPRGPRRRPVHRDDGRRLAGHRYGHGPPPC
ncbi:MAG TPA: hypothetical protein VLZ05_10055 [Mycobacterium sp.]|nr:hypothetical protein [Mycobacterium sp.]HUH69183.1 hypothetical protein [Mycobacterium sp.]